MTLPLPAANAARACLTACPVPSRSSCVYTAAPGDCATTAALTASWPGPTTTAMRAAPAACEARTACPTIGNLPTGCRTLGIADRMRVPSPAARMIDNNSVMPAPLSTPDFARFYGSNVLGIHYIAAMVNYPKAPRFERLGGVWVLAKASDQFQARDVTFWGVFALVVWGVAVLGANLSALIPDSVLGGLHASRLGGATLNQLRGQVDALATQAALLKQENTVLVQRFMVNEQASGEVTRRVGALELPVPKILETLNNSSGVDQSAVTASTGTTAKPFDTDGGSVSYTTTPMPGM